MGEISRDVKSRAYAYARTCVRTYELCILISTISTYVYLLVILISPCDLYLISPDLYREVGSSYGSMAIGP